MMQFMREGGYGTWLVLVFSLLCLVLAVSFAARPSERKLGMLRPLSLATVFAAVGAVASGLGATMKHVATNPEWSHSPDVHLYVMIGIGESMSSAILGFTALSLAWLIAAVGLRRQV